MSAVETSLHLQDKSQMHHSLMERRSYMRTALPMTVEIGPQSYGVANWSIGGFQLADGLSFTAALGRDIFRVRCNIIAPSMSTTIETDVVPTRLANGVIVAFRFISLTSEQTSVLSQLSNEVPTDWKSAFRSEDDFTEAPAQILSETAPQAHLLMHKVVRSAAAARGTFSGLAGVILLFAPLILIGGILAVRPQIAQSLLMVKSADSVVVGPVHGLVSPTAGMLMFDQVHVGDSLQVGDRLASLRVGEAGHYSTATQDILSPCHCALTGLAVSGGAEVVAGQSLAHVTSLDQFGIHIAASVDTAQARFLVVGQPVAVYVPNVGLPIAGNLTTLNYQAEDFTPATKAISVLISIRDWPGVGNVPVPGAQVKVHFPIPASRLAQVHFGWIAPFLDRLLNNDITVIDNQGLRLL